MAVGQHAELLVPHALAYGPKGRPPKIPPAATLWFELEVIEVVDTPGEQLLDAAGQGDARKLRQLLGDAGADVNHLDHKGASALHAASACGMPDCVVLLLEHGATPDLPNAAGVTPLMLATRALDRPAVGALLVARASPHAASAKGSTPTKLASSSGDGPLIELLASAGSLVASEPSGLGVGEEGPFDSASWEVWRCSAFWMSRMRRANPKVGWGGRVGWGWRWDRLGMGMRGRMGR